MRGIKNKNFWIMEQLSGIVGSWTPMSRAIQPGMLKGYSLQAIAHGADAVIHFRWRTAVSGAERFQPVGFQDTPGRRDPAQYGKCAEGNYQCRTDLYLSEGQKIRGISGSLQ